MPSEDVAVAALDGENADPANGVTLEPGLLARSLWGEMAYRLAGREGFERVRTSDETHVAPGTDTLVELFGDRPALILIDEVAVYLRKVARVHPDKADQFAAFLQSLLKAVSTSPRAVLVFTLAVNAEDSSSKDAYGPEQQIAMAAFDEAVKVAGRKATVLNPTRDDETAAVLRRRLFESVDADGAAAAVAAYRELWKRHAGDLPADAADARTAAQFQAAYPFHPEVMATLMEKTSGLATFQRTRGMLRLLSRTVSHLWNERPADATAIHLHHVDPGHGPIREEVLTRWEQNAFAPALGADVAAAEGLAAATAEQIDTATFPGRPPIASYLARTVFLHTLAPESVRGVNAEQLRFSLLGPSIEPAFVEQARKQFVEKALYLDDRPGSPLRFMAQPNLVQLVSRHSGEIDSAAVKARLDERVRDLFAGNAGRPFEPVFFPGDAHAIPDEVGDGKPLLVVLHHDAQSVAGDPGSLPEDLATLATTAGAGGGFRKFLNNLVFVVAEHGEVNRMKAQTRRQLGLERLQSTGGMEDLADYQQARVKEMTAKVGLESAVAIAQCYRHLFYPDRGGMTRGRAKLSHTPMGLADTASDPGNCQKNVQRALADHKKVLSPGDEPDAPAFVRDQTTLKQTGEVTTANLRDQFRQAPNLSILLGDEPLTACIRRGIDQGVFVYRVGEQVYGKGDPAPNVAFSDQAFVHTMEDAKAKKLWPRPEPEPAPPKTAQNGTATAGPGTGTSTAGDVGAQPAEQPAPGTFAAQGSLGRALTDVFDNARDAGVAGFASLSIKLFNPTETWNFHQAAAALKGPVTTCTLDASMSAEGVEEFEVVFRGSMAKANQVKSFLTPHLASAAEASLEGIYDFDYAAEPLATDTGSEESLKASLTKFGGGQAFVEASAATA